MNESNRRATRHFSAGTGLYIALFLGVTALTVAGYWLLLPSDTDNSDEIVPVQETTPLTVASETGDDTAVAPPTVEEAAPVQSTVEVSVPAPSEPVTPTAPRLVVAPLEGEVLAAFSVEELRYSETLADWRTHDGVDIAAPEGTQVLAACSGTVRAVTDDDLMGTCVVLDHGDGCETLYANLRAAPAVETGEYVSAGQVIGAVGTTALAEASAAPHLHFAVTRDGVSVDPQEFLEE